MEKENMTEKEKWIQMIVRILQLESLEQIKVVYQFNVKRRFRSLLETETPCQTRHLI